MNEITKQQDEYIDELDKEYKDILYWGGILSCINLKNARRLFKKKHPQLKEPRAFKLNNNVSISEIKVYLLLDLLPLYLKEKNKTILEKEKCK